ncbi:MAG: choice-of-anchor Q domain-containing protein [Pleurocapsa sp. MO_192.B19]|nr:choice-of-anchor Q domain-containing protein [Pleurocapsa sp. MO_192.B19]
MTINYQEFTAIVFIDSKVDNYQSLIAGIAPEAKIVLINPANDGVEKITETLKTANYQEVHLISHGSPGCLNLGNNQLNLDNLDNYASELQTWFHTSSCIAHPVKLVLLYGCNVAAGDAGAEFIAKLKQLTGAEIAATSNLTGNKTLGGDWELEVTTSRDIKVNLAIEESTRQSYQGILTSLTVTTADDEDDGDLSAGDLSLREAIAIADDGSTITFDSNLSDNSIILNQGELLIDKSLNINGLGANNLTVSGNDRSRVFKIDDGDAHNQANVSIDGLTISDGRSSEGGSSNQLNGGGFLNQENLTVTNSAIVDNDAGNGGAIYSTGQLQLDNSLVSENSGGTAPIFNDGGVASISNTTITNNGTAGIGAIANNRGSELRLSNSTVTSNNAFDAAVFNGEDSTFNVSSSIIAGNSGDVDPERDDIIGTFVSEGNNLIGNSNGGNGFDSPSDLVGTADNPVEPQLGQLQDNGGSTQTIALQQGSPAIDAGSNPNNLETDQRGEGFDRTVGNGTDIGAFEVQNGDGGGTPTELVVSTLEDENDGDFSTGDLSLREAVALANQQEGADTITFDSDLSGGTITFNQSLERDLIIDESLAVVGLGQDNLTVDGGFIFNNAQTDTDLAIDGLNITGGQIDSYGNLTLTNSTISETIPRDGSSDNSSIISRGTANISDSTIRDNSGGDDIGILIESGTANIERSTIANNEGVLGGSGVLILSDETVNISNSTITNNRNRFAGGVANAGGGTVNINNSTIANNNGGLGSGGIQNSFGTVRVTSSILANNTGGGFMGDISGDGEFISGGNNLISNGDDASGFVDGVNGDLVGSNGDDGENPQTDLLIDARLGELQDNGGSTETLALQEGSPAIDVGSNPNNLETDQRGEGFNRTVGNGTDIGAFEVQNGDGGPTPTELVVSTLEDENDGDFSAGDLSLREAVALANQQVGNDTITFDESLNGGTISIDESLDRQLIVDDSVTISGLGQDNLTLDGGFIFSVPESDINLTIDSLNLTGGKIDSFGNLTLTNSTISQTIGMVNNSSNNSAIISRGTAVISDSSIRDNNTGNSAGDTGISIESGTATIEQSTISDNQAQTRSGIIIGSDATVNLISSTVAGNRSRSLGGVQNDGILNIVNSTVADNGGGDAGGINNTGSISLTSSIVANNNSDSILTDISGDGQFISGGNNLISNGDNLTNLEDTDIAGTTDNPIDPQLGELQDNGGITQTIALLEGSPAIDAGSNPNNLETDQRGEGFNRTVGNGTDIGAFEVQNVENLYIRGTNADDILTGGQGNDTIKGRNGDDSISGGSGNDLLNGGRGDDTIDAGSGDDTVSGGGGDDSLAGEEGNDLLNGGRGNDTIDAGSGDDIVSGGRGDDVLVGGDGNDTLNGNRGKDIFVLQSNQGEDTIVNFSNGNDLLGLTDTLSFDNLNIVQNDLNTTIHDLTNNNETLATLVNVNAAHINAHDFTKI